MVRVRLARAGPDGMMTLPRQDPITAFLSVFGVTGLTAYFGMLDIGKPKEGETVVVSGAAGAVGSVAARSRRSSAAAWSASRAGRRSARWLTDELGFDAAIDYKSEDVGARLASTARTGSTSTSTTSAARSSTPCSAQITLHARIVLCGAISQYNDGRTAAGPAEHPQPHPAARSDGGVHPPRLPRPLPRRHPPVGPMGRGGSHPVLGARRRRPRELLPAAFRKLFSGENTGKLIIKVAE